MTYFERFSRTLATNKGTNMVKNTCITEQPLLSKITTDRLWSFSCLEVCMHLISNFTYNHKIFERLSSSCYGIFLKWNFGGTYAKFYIYYSYYFIALFYNEGGKPPHKKRY